MEGTPGSVEAFLAESVAALTRPFTCDGVGLETLSASDRGAVSASCTRAPRLRPAAEAPALPQGACVASSRGDRCARMARVSC